MLPEEWRGGDPVQYIDLSETEWSPKLRFQRVPEAKTVKDRIHLDLRVDDIDEVAARVIALGAERAPGGDFREFDGVFRVMLDPEGNEFCLVLDTDCSQGSASLRGPSADRCRARRIRARRRTAAPTRRARRSRSSPRRIRFVGRSLRRHERVVGLCPAS